MAHLSYKNVTVTIGSTAITGSCNQASVQGALNILEDSGFGDDDRTYLPGLHGKTFSLNGWLNSTVEALLGPYVADRATAGKSIALANGASTFTGTCYPTNVQFSGSQDALQTWSADFTVDGNLARA